jgi:hypothetical protein
MTKGVVATLTKAVYPALFYLANNRSMIQYFDQGGNLRNFAVPLVPLPPFTCSGYARISAEKLFPERMSAFVRGSAWDLKYLNPAVAAMPNLENAKPGQLVTFYNPKSKFNTNVCGKPDMRGNPRTATHVGLLLDFNSQDQALILHQYGIIQTVNDLDTLKEKRGLEAVDLIG